MRAMDTWYIVAASRVVLTLLSLHHGTLASTEAACQRKCEGMRIYLSRFAYSQAYLDNNFVACYNKCLYPNQSGSIGLPDRKRPGRPVTRSPTLAPPTTQFVWTQKPTTPFVWTQKPTTPFVWTPRPTTPFVWTPRPTTQFVWTPKPTTPFVWTPRPTTQFVWTPKPTTWTPKPTTPFVWTQKPTTKFVQTQKPTTPFVPNPDPITQQPTRPSLIGCGFRRQFSSRIIAGVPAESCEFPWMVVVKVPMDFCGGSILDKRHVMTAAHCVKDLFYNTLLPPASISVKLGSSRQSQLRVVKASNVYAHPKHNFFRDYDVAIIELAEDLEFGSCIAPICLPAEGQRAQDMQECTVAGWGVMNPSRQTNYQPDVLQKVTLPIVSQAKCESSYGNRYVNNLKLCAGFYTEGGKDSCRGDSGGPLMCRNSNGPYYAFGITSFGQSCALPFYPGVYTKVTNPEIMQFILQTINEDGSNINSNTNVNNNNIISNNNNRDMFYGGK